MNKIKQDLDIMTDITSLREEHGNKIKFQLIYKFQLLYQYNASFKKVIEIFLTLYWACVLPS